MIELKSRFWANEATHDEIPPWILNNSRTLQLSIVKSGPKNIQWIKSGLHDCSALLRQFYATENGVKVDLSILLLRCILLFHKQAFPQLVWNRRKTDAQWLAPISFMSQLGKSRNGQPLLHPLCNQWDNLERFLCQEESDAEGRRSNLVCPLVGPLSGLFSVRSCYKLPIPGYTWQCLRNNLFYSHLEIPNLGLECSCYERSILAVVSEGLCNPEILRSSAELILDWSCNI